MSKPGDIYRRFRDDFPPPHSGSLRIHWRPQIPCNQFYWPVRDLREAASILDMLAAYDDFQFSIRVKGDYSNSGGLEIFRYGQWEEWESADFDDFDTWRESAEGKKIMGVL